MIPPSETHICTRTWNALNYLIRKVDVLATLSADITDFQKVRWTLQGLSRHLPQRSYKGAQIWYRVRGGRATPSLGACIDSVDERISTICEIASKKALKRDYWKKSHTKR